MSVSKVVKKLHVCRCFNAVGWSIQSVQNPAQTISKSEPSALVSVDYAAFTTSAVDKKW